MPRFVILEHDHPHLHWDLMLEAEGVLRTWRLAELPRSGHAIDALAIGDHRLAYLDYEGAVSGGRGSVRRWDAGTFDWNDNGPVRLVVQLQGQRCRGSAELRATQLPQWTFVLNSACVGEPGAVGIA